MAIYHLSMSNVSRGRGSSSVASASYITGKRMLDDTTNETYNYGRRQRVVAHGTILPPGADPAWDDPEKLWNEVERADKNKNARPAKKVVLALPREFDRETQRTVLEQFIREQLTSHGYAATWAIHDDGDGNPHAHILVANRPLKANGKWGPKSVNSYKLDENGERIPVIDPKTGAQKIGARHRRMWQSIKIPHRLDTVGALTDMRAAWSEICNARLAPDQAIDHRSFKEQGRDDLPTIHEGYAARRMEAAGHTSERCEINREIMDSREVQEVTETDLVRMGEAAVTTPGGLRDVCEAAAMYPSVSAARLAAIVGYANLPTNCITEWRPPTTRPLVISIPVNMIMAESPADEPVVSAIITAIAQAAAGQMMMSIPGQQLAEAASTIGGHGIIALVRKAVRWLVSKMREIADRLQRNKRKPEAEPTVAHAEDVIIAEIQPMDETIVDQSDDAEIAAILPMPAVGKEAMPALTTDSTVQIVSMRPTTEEERRRILQEAQKRIEQTDIVPWMEKHDIKKKAKRMRCGGRRMDVLRMADGSTIVVNGRSWTYADRAGLTGGGSLIQFALTFVEPYRSFDSTGGANWTRAVRELAEEICPDVVRYINQRPMTPEETAIDDGGVRQEKQPLYIESHQHAMTECAAQAPGFIHGV